MRTRVAPLVFAALLAAALIIVADDVFRRVVIDPLLYVAWYVSVLAEATPQGVFWAILIFITLYLVLRSLGKKHAKRQEAKSLGASNRGPVATWATLLARAEQQDMSKWRLAKGLKTLAWEIMPRKDTDSMDTRRRRKRRQHTELPADIHNYFEAPLPTYQRFPRLSRLQRTNSGPKDLSLEPETVVAFLEEKTDPLTGE